MRLGKSWSGLLIRANGLGSSPWRSPRKRRLPRTVRRRGFVRPAFRFAGERRLSFVLGFRYSSCLQSKGKRLKSQAILRGFVLFFAKFCCGFERLFGRCSNPFCWLVAFEQVETLPTSEAASPLFRFQGSCLVFVLSWLQSKGKSCSRQVFREVFSAIFGGSFRAEKAEGILALHDDKGGMVLEPINASLEHSYNLASHVERLGLLEELPVFDDGVLFVCFNHTNNIQEKAARVKFFVKFFQKTFAPLPVPLPLLWIQKKENCAARPGGWFFSISKLISIIFKLHWVTCVGKQRGAPYVLYN